MQAFAVEPPPPPVEEGERALVEGDPQEAQVVHAREQEVALAGDEPVRDRRRDVRGEQRVGRVEAAIDPAEVGEHQDVGVEVAEAVEAERPVEVEQQARLDRRVELEDRVAERVVGERRDAELLHEEGGEGLRRVVDRRLRAVDDEHHHPPVGVLGEERTREHPRVGEVVVGDDGTGGGDVHRILRSR